MRRILASSAASAVCLLLGIGSTAQAGLILKSSFETPAIANGSFVDYPTGTSLDGWTVASGDVDYIHDVYAPLPFPDGHQAIDLDGDVLGSISRTLITLPGQTYMLDFDLSANNTVSSSNAAVTELDIGSFSKNFSSTSGSWSHYTQNFTATSASTLLKFSSVSPPGFYGPVLDNVTVQDVPEPASLGALGVGLLALVGAKKKLVL